MKIGTADAGESLVIEKPAAGTYKVTALLYASVDEAPTTGTIEGVALTGTAGNATLTPNPLVLANGSTGPVALNWTGLTAGTYVGRVSYTGSPSLTYVRVIGDGAGVTTVEPSSDSAAVTPADRLGAGPREATTPIGDK